MKRRGFTIVELLVVIGIVTILISLLLPALNKARKVSRQVACSSNLRQIVLATINYAADNKNRIPERFQYGTDINSGPGPMTWAYFNSYNANGFKANTCNILRLTEKGYLSGGWVQDTLNAGVPWLWCPAANTDATAAPGPANTLNVSSYLFNPHMRETGTIDDSRYTRIDKIPRNRVVVTDILWYPDSIFHPTSQGSAGWNMGFPDGHVVFIESKDLYLYITNVAPAGSGFGTNGYKTDYEVDRAVDFLETIAEGGDPFTTSITTTGAFTTANFLGIRLTGGGSNNGKQRTVYNPPELADQLP